jgi:fructokinase
MERFFKAIKEIAETNPLGFTVDLTTLKKVTTGISVAYIETQDSFGDEGLKKVLKHALENEKK